MGWQVLVEEAALELAEKVLALEQAANGATSQAHNQGRRSLPTSTVVSQRILAPGLINYAKKKLTCFPSALQKINAHDKRQFV